MWRKPSQAAISPDTGDGWTAAKRRIMLMFVLIIKRMKVEYINMSIDETCFFIAQRPFSL